ncbi:hypothetical protein DPEC_G00002380 [Dallia pectoralis]|uniref:Uncharacterized protein n=1 Tax=Dallia pectoralis TaxID=75939 RepID=A0ACC2HKH8_DALPE|nr:hypothetical protein DPEC_G00002380 [Dallia pectoralis]
MGNWRNYEDDHVDGYDHGRRRYCQRFPSPIKRDYRIEVHRIKVHPPPREQAPPNLLLTPALLSRPRQAPREQRMARRPREETATRRGEQVEQTSWEEEDAEMVQHPEPFVPPLQMTLMTPHQ